MAEHPRRSRAFAAGPQPAMPASTFAHIRATRAADGAVTVTNLEATETVTYRRKPPHGR